MKVDKNSSKEAGTYIVFKENETVELSLKDVFEEVTFTLVNGVQIELNIYEFSLKTKLNLFINENSKLNLHLISDTEMSLDILGNVQNNGILNIYFADLKTANTTLNSNVILLGDNAKSCFKFSSIAKENIKKLYNIGFNHVGKKTTSDFEGYGVALKNGEIDAKGISHIEKMSIKSYANQMVKVILFDKESKAKASPTLKIDCDDIVANHACAIGSLNEDHVFYLRSRGLSEEESRKLITLGYLLPIEDNFDEEGKNKIKSFIKESF